MSLFKGYRLINLPYSKSKAAVHHIYIKEHVDRQSQNKTQNDLQPPRATGRILFVGNVDYNIDMTHSEIDLYLRQLFSRFGDIESISVSTFTEDDEENTRFAHIVFRKKSSIKVALNATEEDYALAVKETIASLGGLKPIKQKSALEIKKMFPWNEVDPAELQRDVDSFMKEFEEDERQEEIARNEAKNVPDEDGFITVVRKRKHGAGDGENDQSNFAKNNSGRKKKKKNLELKNFYKFQIREEKMKQLDLLRKKFAEDKQKVARMKENRKFKPF